MNDYISRQEALDLIESAGTWGWSESQLYDEISELTAADVRPVMYGKWVKIYEDGEPAIEQHQIGVFCSKCMKIPKDRFTESEFCPHCGADMRGKSNE